MEKPSIARTTLELPFQIEHPSEQPYLRRIEEGKEILTDYPCTKHANEATGAKVVSGGIRSENLRKHTHR